MSFRLSDTSKTGTPVPRSERERAAPSPGIRYTLSPEELEKYSAMPKPGEKVPIGVNIDRRTEELRNQRSEQETMKINLTRDQYLEKRLSGMNRNQIAIEQGCKNSGALYYYLSQWGLKDPVVEERELAKLRDENQKATEEFKNTALADQLQGIKAQLEQRAEPADEEVAATKESEFAPEHVTLTNVDPHPFAAGNMEHLSHQLLLSKLHDTYVAKNADYGSSFSKLYEEFGMVSAVIRLSDKLNRVKSLAKQPANVTDESLRDTLLDLANYAVMAVMELDKASV